MKLFGDTTGGCFDHLSNKLYLGNMDIRTDRSIFLPCTQNQKAAWTRSIGITNFEKSLMSYSGLYCISFVFLMTSNSASLKQSSVALGNVRECGFFLFVFITKEGWFSNNFTCYRLVSERGLPALRHMFDNVKFKGKGHEVRHNELFSYFLEDQFKLIDLLPLCGED